MVGAEGSHPRHASPAEILRFAPQRAPLRMTPFLGTMWRYRAVGNDPVGWTRLPDGQEPALQAGWPSVGQRDQQHAVVRSVGHHGQVRLWMDIHGGLLGAQRENHADAEL